MRYLFKTILHPLLDKIQPMRRVSNIFNFLQKGRAIYFSNYSHNLMGNLYARNSTPYEKPNDFPSVDAWSSRNDNEGRKTTAITIR